MLKTYFGRPETFAQSLLTYGTVWVSAGDSWLVLRLWWALVAWNVWISGGSYVNDATISAAWNGFLVQLVKSYWCWVSSGYIAHPSCRYTTDRFTKSMLFSSDEFAWNSQGTLEMACLIWGMNDYFRMPNYSVFFVALRRKFSRIDLATKWLVCLHLDCLKISCLRIVRIHLGNHGLVNCIELVRMQLRFDEDSFCLLQDWSCDGICVSYFFAVSTVLRWCGLGKRFRSGRYIKTRGYVDEHFPPLWAQWWCEPASCAEWADIGHELGT